MQVFVLVISTTLRILWVFDSEDFLLKEPAGGPRDGCLPTLGCTRKSFELGHYVFVI